MNSEVFNWFIKAATLQMQQLFCYFDLYPGQVRIGKQVSFCSRRQKKKPKAEKC